jgi:hypothetical protein
MLSTPPFSERDRRSAYAAHEQMPAIGHLNRLRGSFLRCSGILAPAIAADHFDLGMLLEPRTNRLHGPIRQEIQRSSRFEITNQRPIVQAAFVGPVINANELGCFLSRRLSLPNETQQAIRAAWQPELTAQTSACFASQG